MPSPPFVSIIIPTYNRAKLLPITIDSFIDQDYPKDRYEIIVSNNNSTDDTQNVIDSYRERCACVRSLREDRQGVHYARNSAAKLAKGEILYFTDDDMIADSALLKEIVKGFDLDPLIGSATGRILPRFEVPPPRWVKKHLTNHLLSLTNEDKPEELIVSSKDIVYSCHQAIRREVFFSCGGFNPENTAGVWIGDGETGLGMRIKRSGYKFAYLGKSVIYHMIPPSRTTLSYLIKRFSNQGNSDSYSDYRSHSNRDRLIHDLLRRNTVGALRTLKTTVLGILAGNASWHFLPAYFAYFYRRTLYDIKLYRDPTFRELVEVDDWLAHDK